jgi:hypothetical protein
MTKILNDLVEQAHVALHADEKYNAFLLAVDNKQAVELRVSPRHGHGGVS